MAALISRSNAPGSLCSANVATRAALTQNIVQTLIGSQAEFEIPFKKGEHFIRQYDIFKIKKLRLYSHINKQKYKFAVLCETGIMGGYHIANPSLNNSKYI